MSTPEVKPLTTATNKVLRFMQPNDDNYEDGDLAVRIERGDDGWVYDANNPTVAARIFKIDSACINPFIPLIKGHSNNAGRLEAYVTIDANFKDGGYIANFHDMRSTIPNIISMDLFGIWNGSASLVEPFTDYDLCIRILAITVASHKTPAGSVGAWLNDMLAKVNDIQTKVTAIKTKLGA